MSVYIWFALRWRYPKTSAVVGNLRIKDVAGMILKSSHTYKLLASAAVE